MAVIKVVGYLRVSTDKQAEKGQGLPVQRQDIKSWAKSRGFRVVEFVADEGLSGANGLESRVALGDALELIRSGRCSGIAVQRLDRLARDLVVQETLLAEVRRLGGDLFSASESECAVLADDPDDPSRKLIRQILGAVNEYEKALVVLRLRAGRRKKAEKGGFAYGAPPFGWEASEGDLVAHPAQQATIRRVDELVEAGTSVRQIADTLNAEGHAPSRPGARWHPTTVARLLARDRPK